MSDDAREKLAALALEDGLVLKMGRSPGGPALGKMLERLILAEWSKRAEQPTIYALAQSEPDRARALMTNALDLFNGDAVRARAAIGQAIGRTAETSERDWRRARDLLGLGDKVKKRAGKTGGKDSP